MPRLRKAVRILEMNLDKDHASEGRFVQQFLEVLNVPSDYRAVSNKKEFVTELSRPEVQYVHISSHGYAVDRQAAFTLPNYDEFGPEDVAGLKGLLRGRIVVASGCFTGRIALAREVLRSGCTYYIAPRRATPWADAGVFHALLYRYHFAKGYSIPKAFELARTNSEALGDWRLYPDLLTE